MRKLKISSNQDIQNAPINKVSNTFSALDSDQEDSDNDATKITTKNTLDNDQNNEQNNKQNNELLVSEDKFKKFVKNEKKNFKQKQYGDHKTQKTFGEHTTKTFGEHKTQKTFGDHKTQKTFGEHEQKKQETKKLYVEPENYCEEKENELGNTKFLNSSWTVWIHKANVGPEIENWTEDTYTSIYVINSIGTFWRFFNNFQMLDKINYQYFIMRNKIKPIWEDNNNRNGSICSFKVEYGPCAMTCMSLLIMNETFMMGNEDINGISYSVKNKIILIKIWYKIGSSKVVDKIPIEFMNRLDAFIKNNDKYGRRDNSSITIKYSKIDPKYNISS